MWLVGGPVCVEVRTGQRRELNVLKRLRMSGALLILLWKCEDLAVWTSVEKDESKD